MEIQILLLVGWMVFHLKTAFMIRNQKRVAALIKYESDEPVEISAYEVKFIDNIGYILFDYEKNKTRIVKSLNKYEVGSIESFGIFLKSYNFI